MESNCVIWVVKQLMMLGGVSLSQIGVITPYAAQVRQGEGRAAKGVCREGTGLMLEVVAERGRVYLCSQPILFRIQGLKF